MYDNKENFLSNQQNKIVEAIESVNLAFSLLGLQGEEPHIVFHNHAIDNSPGWNVFIKNMRFELGFNRMKIRFSIPYEKEKLDSILDLLKNKLSLNYKVENKTGIKYIFEISLEDEIYTDNTIRKIASLTSKVLELS